MNRSTRSDLFRSGTRRAVLAGIWLWASAPAWAQQQSTEPAAAPAPAPAAEPAATPAPATEPAAAPPPTPAAPPPAPAPSSSAVVVKASSEGFNLSSEDKAFQLKLRGYVHADTRAFLNDTEQRGTTTFALRRARPIVEGTLFGSFDFRVMLDFGGGTATVQDAYLDIRPSKALRLRAGKYKPPFGLERLQSATQILFVERALPTNLLPNRDIGLQVHGDLAEGALSYAVGAFNGVPDGSSADANSDNSLDLVGRVFSHPFRGTSIEPLKGLGLGLAVSQGQRFGTPAASGLAALRSTAQLPFFSYLTGATADTAVIAQGEHTRLSPQGYYFFGPVGLLGEYVSSAQEVQHGAERAKLTHKSWQAAGYFVLFGGKASYEGVKPTQPLQPSKGTWGAVELVARYNTLTIDPDTFPTFADPARSARKAKSWGVGTNWYLSSNVRFALNVDGTSFEGGAADDGDRPSETLLLSRFQVSW
jgi:phosphate-selective porin OprO/OprP